MENSSGETHLTSEEQRLKDRLVRPGNSVSRKGSVEVSEEFRRLSRTQEGRRVLIKQIARSGEPDDIKPGRPVSEEFWNLPKVKDPEGLLLRALLEDRRESR